MNLRHTHKNLSPQAHNSLKKIWNYAKCRSLYVCKFVTLAVYCDSMTSHKQLAQAAYNHNSSDKLSALMIRTCRGGKKEWLKKEARNQRCVSVCLTCYCTATVDSPWLPSPPIEEDSLIASRTMLVPLLFPRPISALQPPFRLVVTGASNQRILSSYLDRDNKTCFKEGRRSTLGGWA